MIITREPVRAGSSFRHFSGILNRFAFLLIFPVLICVFSCQSQPETSAVQSTISLLSVTPFIGSETELRNPPPSTERVLIAGDSVESWKSPPEAMLRFPIDLKQGAQFSVRVGAVSDISVAPDELIVKIEFRKIPENKQETDIPPSVIFEAKPIEQNWTKYWQDVEIPLDKLAPAKGEIIFKVEGAFATNPDVKIYWGQPAVYYPDERRNKNILLIGIDTLRADALEPYGGRTGVTPGFVALTNTATLFKQARSQAPWTTPSFASMITGRYPCDISPSLNFDRIPDFALTLAEILRPLGYTTGTVCGNPHMGDQSSGFQQGIDNFWYLGDAAPRESVKKTREFIYRSRFRDWFCFLHIMDPHTPYIPPLNFAEKFCDPNYTGEIGYEFNLEHTWSFLETPPPEQDIRRARDLYDSEVANLDEELETLFAYLAQTGLMEKTLIIVASDHGEEFFEHGRFKHGHTLYDELIRLPLIVKGPGFFSGSEIETPVGNIDIAPSILKYVGVPIPDNMPGIPLQDVIAGKVGPKRLIYGEMFSQRSSHGKYALEWPYKCLLDFFTGETALYDLVADPGEKIDIASANPDIVNNLAQNMISNLPAMRNEFLVLFAGDPSDEKHIFNGTIEIPGGIALVNNLGLGEEDKWFVRGNTVTVKATNPRGEFGVIKGLEIILNPDADVLKASLDFDGNFVAERFYPYGTDQAALSETIEVNLSNLPWPAHIPPEIRKMPSACYIVGIPGVNREEIEDGLEQKEFSQETIEQLRALGYVN